MRKIIRIKVSLTLRAGGTWRAWRDTEGRRDMKGMEGHGGAWRDMEE